MDVCHHECICGTRRPTLTLASALSKVVSLLLPPVLLAAGVTGPALVPAVPELLDPAALVERVVPGVVAVALDAELRVAAVEDELLPVTHAGPGARGGCGKFIKVRRSAVRGESWCCGIENGTEGTMDGTERIGLVWRNVAGVQIWERWWFWHP